MKKFTLSVSEPCHENWEAMTKEDRGRFCASCQKTVVDFTNMSDRQLAEFFRKPKESVCGRFYNDQLNRNIDVPSKSIPWARHLFPYTWPAFALFLNSCGQKETTVGKMQINQVKTKQSAMTMGMALPEIKQQDSIFVPPVVDVDAMTTVGDVAMLLLETDTVRQAETGKDSITLAGEESADSVLPTVIPVNAVSSCNKTTGEVVVTMGFVGINIGKPKTKKADTAFVPIAKLPAPALKPQPSVFPNPVTNGQQLTILAKEKMQGIYEVVSMSGQVLRWGKLTVEEKQAFYLPVNGWPAGSYVVRLIDEASGKSFTQKLIVL